jgi:hypothetical protein
MAEGCDRTGVGSDRVPVLDAADPNRGWGCYQLCGTGCGRGDVLGSDSSGEGGHSWDIGSTRKGLEGHCPGGGGGGKASGRNRSSEVIAAAYHTVPYA